MRWCQPSLEMKVKAITRMFTYKSQNVSKDTTQNKEYRLYWCSRILIHGKAFKPKIWSQYLWFQAVSKNLFWGVLVSRLQENFRDLNLKGLKLHALMLNGINNIYVQVGVIVTRELPRLLALGTQAWSFVYFLYCHNLQKVEHFELWCVEFIFVLQGDVVLQHLILQSIQYQLVQSHRRH